MDSDRTIQVSALATAAVCAIAALVAAVRGFEASWFGRFGSWILGGLLTVGLVVGVVFLLGAACLLVLMAIPSVVHWLRDKEDAPVMLPGALACLSAVLFGSAQEVLP